MAEATTSLVSSDARANPKSAASSFASKKLQGATLIAIEVSGATDGMTVTLAGTKIIECAWRASSGSEATYQAGLSFSGSVITIRTDNGATGRIYAWVLK